MSDATFGTWSATASPLTVEYSLVVIEEIRHEVAEGFQKLSRGGIEVGGLLYGLHDGKNVRIMAIRPVACEHAAGPTFRLSERDRASLQDQLRHQDDPRLDGLACVGWYVSHTRTEVALTESDQEIFSTYFGQPWQVTLVIRPSRGGSMRAGFFVREPDGTVNAQSYQEFAFPDRLAAVFDHRGDQPRAPVVERDRPVPENRGVPRVARAPRIPIPEPVAAPEVRPPTPAAIPTSSHISSGMTTLFGEPARASTPEPADTSKAASPEPDSAKTKSAKTWLWLVAALIVIAALAVAGARYLASDLTKETMALNVLEREGQLNIEWNRAASPVTRAIQGTLEIADGPQTRTIPLKPADLAQGKFSYKRETGDIQVRMMVEDADGKKIQEASRFLGPAPSQGNTEELKTLQQRRDELEAEVSRLKQSNDQQAQRIQQLERTLKILQTRQGNE